MEFGYFNFLDRSYLINSNDLFDFVEYKGNLEIANATNYEKIIIANIIKEHILEDQSEYNIIDLYRTEPFLLLFSHEHNIENLSPKYQVLYYIDCDIEKNIYDDCYIFFQPDDEDDFGLSFDTTMLELHNDNKELIKNYLNYFDIHNVEISKIFNITKSFNYVEALLTLEYLRLTDFKQIDLKSDIKYIIEEFIKYIAKNENIDIDEVKRRLLLYTKKKVNLHFDIDELFKKYFRLFVRYENKRYIINSDLIRLLNDFLEYKDIDFLVYQNNKETFEKLSIEELINNPEVLVETLLQINSLRDKFDINITEYYKKDILNLKFIITFVSYCKKYCFKNIEKLYDWRSSVVLYFSEINVGRATKKNIHAKYKKYILTQLNRDFFWSSDFFENKEEFIKELLAAMKIEDITLLPKKDQELINKLKDEK